MSSIPQADTRILDGIVGILKKISDFLEKSIGILCMLLVSVMFIIVMVQVILRAARASAPWSEELSRMLLIWIGMLGAGVAAKQGLHVGVDFLAGILPERASRVLGIFIKGILIWFLAFFSKYGYLSALAGLRVSSATMDINMFLPKLALPVGAILMLIHLVYLIGADLQQLINTGKVEA